MMMTKMITSYELRRRFVDIARLDANKEEDTRNRAPWIAKLWPATESPEFYKKGNKDYPNGDPPYCAAGICYVLKKWLEDNDVLAALKKTAKEAEKWRCKSPGAKKWKTWAEKNGVRVLPKDAILHLGDIVIYDYSHIEIVTGDDDTNTGPFVAIGYNTDPGASRDGNGCFEKPRTRKKVLCFLRILP